MNQVEENRRDAVTSTDLPGALDIVSAAVTDLYHASSPLKTSLIWPERRRRRRRRGRSRRRRLYRTLVLARKSNLVSIASCSLSKNTDRKSLPAT